MLPIHGVPFTQASQGRDARFRAGIAALKRAQEQEEEAVRLSKSL
jgi:hypothetical protein